jgi:hypothetical protein
LKAFSQISLKADERDVYEFFSRAGKVIAFHISFTFLLASKLNYSVTVVGIDLGV